MIFINNPPIDPPYTYMEKCVECDQTIIFDGIQIECYYCRTLNYYEANL